MREPIKDAGMLRDEARFALAFAALLLTLGLGVAIAHAIAALYADPVPIALQGALLSGPLILLGWIACRYAAWRLEQALAIEARRRAARKTWRQRMRRGAAFVRRLKQTMPALAAKAAKRQQELKLYLVGE